MLEGRKTFKLKKYNKNRLARELKQKLLTKYEEWLFKKVRKEFVPVKIILSIRNKFTESQLKYYNLKKKEISKTSIYNTVKNIEKKLLMPILLTEEQKNHNFIPRGSIWRLHATAFTIDILDATNKYKSLLKKQNKTIEENNTIQFYKDKLVIYSNTDFFGKTVQGCLDDEAKYWNNFLKSLQSKYEIILIKRNRTKIYDFRKHIAKVNDPLAKKILKKDKHYYIKDDNGELIFVIDDSFGYKETESVHKTKVVRNVKKYESFLKDLDRNPDSLLNGDLTLIASDNTSNIRKLIELASKVPKLYENQLRMEQKFQELIEVNTILTKNIITITSNPIKKKENFIPEKDYFY